MSHEIEIRDGKASAFYVSEPAWHGLGVVLKTAPATAAEAIVAANLDWEVEKRAVFTSTGKFLRATPAERAKLTGKDRGIVIPDQYAVVRTTDDAPLGIVGHEYGVFQNREMFSFMDPFLADRSATFEAAMSLKGGRVVCVVVKMRESFEVVPGDGVKDYLLLVSSHDGSRKIRARYTPIRVVCWNTLSQADRGDANSAQGRSESVIDVSHKSQVAVNAKAASEALKDVYVAAKEVRKLFPKLAKARMTASQFDDFTKVLVPDSETAKKYTRTENIREVMARLFHAGKGQQLRGVAETRWAGYNAVTEYVDHVRGIPKNLTADLARAEVRLDSIWFGSGLKLKERALDLLADGVS